MKFSGDQVLVQDRFFVKLKRPIGYAEISYLFQLYQPIVGGQSVSLFQTLMLEVPERHTSSSLSTHRWLMALTGASLEKISKARERLEAVGLFCTRRYRSEEEETYFEYTLFPPLAPVDFFSQDILRMMLLNEVGKTGYEQLRARYAADPSTIDLMGKFFEDETKAFDEVYTHISPQELVSFPGSETEGAITQAHQKYPIHHVDDSLPSGLSLQKELDWEFIQAKLPKGFNREEILTDKVVRAIKEMSFLYHLDSYQIAHFLNEPYIYTDDQNVDTIRLRYVIKEWYDREIQQPVILKDKNQLKDDQPSTTEPEPEKEIEDKAEYHRKLLIKISPLALLKHYQGGGKVSKSDHSLVEELLYSFQLEPGVVNVLLEYVMLTNEKQLPRPLITKIAGHWKRLGIETVEQAQEQARKLFHTPKKGRGYKNNQKAQRSPSQQKKQLPEWIVKQLNEEKDGQASNSRSETKREGSDEDMQEKEREILKMLRELENI